jgi:hypothetical protein
LTETFRNKWTYRDSPVRERETGEKARIERWKNREFEKFGKRPGELRDSFTGRLS